MGARERRAVALPITAVALLLPVFLLHAAPRFPGSLAGSLLGIAGALPFVLLLAYSLVKHVPALRRRARLGAVLSFHVYGGTLGAVLGVLHAGHQYRSPLGIALVVAMLAVVLSGFLGRYHLAQVGTDARNQRQELGALRARYDRLLAGRSPAASGAAAAGLPERSVRALVAAIADLEHAIARREALEAALSRWTVLHVAAAPVLYPLLALHVWSGVYYGLRWLRRGRRRSSTACWRCWAPRRRSPCRWRSTAIGTRAAAAATITVSRSGRSAPLGAGQALLWATESIGYSCRVGVRGTCVVPLCAGIVAMAVEDGLPPEGAGGDPGLPGAAREP